MKTPHLSFYIHTNTGYFWFFLYNKKKANQIVTRNEREQDLYCKSGYAICQ